MRVVLLVFSLLCAAAAHGATVAHGADEEGGVDALLATLHRAQDALATDGESARPVHDRLLRMLDERIRTGPAPSTEAVVRYALSGGDPRIATRALRGIEQTARNAILVRGVLAYVSGRAEAAALLSLIEPERLRGRLAPLVRMAKAGVALREGGAEAEAAKREWDEVRLQAPGTLLEEAALRRLAALAVLEGNTEAFFRIQRLYWWRFGRSAFRDAMARTLREGIDAADEETVLAALPRFAPRLPPRLRNGLYHHLSRAAVLDGRTRLATVAARRHDARDAPERARLVKELVRLTGPRSREVAQRLHALPLGRLEGPDRLLLQAARTVGRAITAPIAAPPRGAEVEGALLERHRPLLRAVDALLVTR